MSIYIGEPIILSDMQGPCPDGFHVPLQSEWQAIVDAGVSLGAWTSNGYVNCQTYLKLPSCGYREGASGGVADTSCFFWTSEINNAYNAKGYLIGTSRIGGGQRGKSYGTPIRPFKNIPVAPDSSWTELYINGIYHNSTLGFISIKNGSGWITISDKNLGATTARNYGDNNTSANCGYFYQRGNNHGFPFTGTVTTSSTQVNASNYGPGNYYDSSTFIISYSYYWDTSYNKNLRGGVTQGTSTKSVEVQNIYIGEVKSYLPGIYHNSSLGLISLSSDGENWTTIADKNLGATTVYNSGDTVSQSNCGYYYQWGNNYGFPVSGPVNTSSSQVNAQNYGPGNYYSSSTYITGQSSNGWDSSNNANLWGGTTDTYEARRGPCSSGYHIPSYTERGNLSTLLFTLLGLTKNGLTLATYLKLPPNGYISSEGGTPPNGMGIYRYYWSSNNVNAWNAFGIYARNDAANLIYGSGKVSGEGIRPFKNKPVVPNSTWTALYQTS